MIMDKKKLDFYYGLLESSILRYQHPITGLIPSSPASSHAWVRDNTYASLSIWALSLVYRKLPDVDEDRSRSYELEKCVVKLMRGLLVCYMKQSGKVELLKKTQNPVHSLHAKFDANSFKTVVGDHQWGHLQIDAISVFLLTLAQMTAAGLRIVWTVEEVAFIQNLVFCIEHAYRIPDYGIWERGDKTNHGLPELNTSSVGMAKAALEALTDLDLFGADGSPLSTIHVSPDECKQCNTVVKSVLPRESNSKETDAALLSILTYPGFSVTDDELIERSRNTIVQKLLGRYGCRRFLRDGFRTAREDVNRLHYEPWELRMFDSIECEWPMFFAWLVIDACFREDLEDADHYMQMLQEVVIPESYNPTRATGSRGISRKPSEIVPPAPPQTCFFMPESYSVPLSAIDAEIAHPHTQDRVPVGALPHIWSQSLYILASIIYEGLLLPGEIDPLGRRLVTEPKPDLSVQVVLVAEDSDMKHQLAENQIDVQTFSEICNDAGIRIYPAKVLSQLYKHLGACEKLELSGRSTREVGILSTSQFYRVADQTVVFIPQFFDHYAFYLNLDVEFLLDCFRTCIAYLKHTWTSPGRPLLIFPIYHSFYRSVRANVQTALFSAIKKMATGYMNGTRVVLGNLKDFEKTSCFKQLDFTESAETLLHRVTSLSVPNTFRRRLTLGSGLDHSDPSGVSSDDNTTNLPSPNSGSPSGCSPAGAEQYSFQRHSMRRKSMALAQAVSLDLCNRNQDWNYDSQASWAGDTEDQGELQTDEDDTGYRLLQIENEDLSSKASRLALKRIINPESNCSPYSFRTQQQSPNHQTPQVSPNVMLDSNTPGLTSQNQSGSHSRRTSDGRASMFGQDTTPDWLNSLSAEQLVKRLRRTNNLAEQVELLGRLHQLQGLDWDTGMDPSQSATVRSLLKEVYERATQSTSWFLLRYVAGLLGKRAEILAKSLTDILVMQKQVTVGLPPEPREKVIDSPLPPDRIAELIQLACGEDSLMTMLTQEILIYLAMIAGTRPQLLANVLRLRIGLIIQMMAAELARGMGLSVEDSLYALFSMRPIDLKRLLNNLLNGEEIRMIPSVKANRRKSVLTGSRTTNISITNQSQLENTLESISGAVKKVSTSCRPVIPRLSSVSASVAGSGGTNVFVEKDENSSQSEMRSLWSRRRKIDGALNRVPPGFYKRVYTILNHVQGLGIGDQVLSHNLTQEMTMGEHKFALAVERACTMISTPEYRQLLIEAAHVLGSLITYDVENSIHLDCVVKLEEIVERANSLFLIDQVKYNANAILCCAKLFKEQNITDLNQLTSQSPIRKLSHLSCHGLHGICQYFYDTPPAGRFGTMSYMVRAVSQLLALCKNVQPGGKLPINCNVQ